MEVVKNKEARKYNKWIDFGWFFPEDSELEEKDNLGGLPYIPGKKKIPYSLVYEPEDIKTPFSFGIEQSFYLCKPDGAFINPVVASEFQWTIGKYDMWYAVEDIMDIGGSRPAIKEFVYRFPWIQNDGIQKELVLPFPVYDMGVAYKCLEATTKILYEAAEKNDMIVVPIGIETEDTFHLTDNHITLGMMDPKQVGHTYNNIRSWIPEAMAPSCNSPDDENKSVRNFAFEQNYPLPRVGKRFETPAYDLNEKCINFMKNQFEQIESIPSMSLEGLAEAVKDPEIIERERKLTMENMGMLKSDYDRFTKKRHVAERIDGENFFKEHHEEKRKQKYDPTKTEEIIDYRAVPMVRLFHTEYVSSLPDGATIDIGKVRDYIRKNIEKHNLDWDSCLVDKQPMRAIPKWFDVVVKKDLETNLYKGYKIESVLPDGMTSAVDIMANLVRIASMHYVRKEDVAMPSDLEVAVLTGRKLHSIAHGTIPYEEANELVVDEWKSLDQVHKENLLKNPLALYNYMKDLGGFTSSTPRKLINTDRMRKWGLQPRMIHEVKRQFYGGCAANTYVKTDEPAYQAFDNLAKNKSWIR